MIARFTSWISLPVRGAYTPSPRYSAVTRIVPAPGATAAGIRPSTEAPDALRIATKLNGVAPVDGAKVQRTLPLGTGPPAVVGIVAVKVTDSWSVTSDGLGELVRIVVGFTTSTRAARARPNTASPSYSAVIRCRPSPRLAVLKLAWPAASVAVPRLVGPS